MGRERTPGPSFFLAGVRDEGDCFRDGTNCAGEGIPGPAFFWRAWVMQGDCLELMRASDGRKECLDSALFWRACGMKVIASAMEPIAPEEYLACLL